MNRKSLLYKALKQATLTTNLGEITDFSKIGEGGNGLVFSSKLNNIDVAIKFLIEERNTKIDRFKAEYLNIKLLENNPYIVEPIHYEEIKVDGQIYPAILMKLYIGSLKRKEPECQEEENILRLFYFLLKAVSFIHSQKIIHRDLKPENILISNNGYKITDFGIAKFCPDTFKFKAKTKKSERLANYLFSAPEQVQGDYSRVNESSDIYAIGQIIHWYFFGETHRGTKRDRFVSVNKKLAFLDEIIDKCLSNSQEMRFKNCNEITQFIKSKLEDRKKEDPWPGIRSFANIIRKCFPRHSSGFFISSGQKIISRFFESLSDSFQGKLVWFNGVSDLEIDRVKRIDNETWLLNQYEIQVSKLFGYSDSSEHADIVFLTLKPMQPFGLNELYEGATQDDIAYLDENIMITMNEYANGFAEIDGEVIDLADRNVEHRSRYLVETTIAIASVGHSAYQIANDTYISSFIDKLPKDDESLEKITIELVKKTRMNRDHEVTMRL